jgi:hypothetical protein
MNRSTPVDVRLATAIARHFPNATLTDREIDLGVGELRLGCRLGAVRPFAGTMETAELLLELRGSARSPIAMTTTGYADSVEHAIDDAADAWVGCFAPVLRAALAGVPDAAVAQLELSRLGTSFRAYVAAFDRVLSFGSNAETTATARLRLAPGSLIERVLRHPRLPALPVDRFCVLGAFVGEMGSRRIVEITLDGVECAGFDELVARAPLVGFQQMMLLRELAIVVPAGPAGA